MSINLSRTMATSSKRSSAGTSSNQTGTSNTVYTYNAGGYVTGAVTDELYQTTTDKVITEKITTTQSYTYTEGRLSGQTTRRVGAYGITTVTDYQFAYDGSGNLGTKTAASFSLVHDPARRPSLKGAVFFTDCDSLDQQTRPGGPPGRMFVTHELSSASVLPTLLRAARNTVRNTDDAENNVEALLFAQHRFPDAKHFILIADNLSTVKDMTFLNGVKKPVHVMLCGTTGSDGEIPFQADYERIARQTGGSLHTLEDDLNPAKLFRNTTLRVGPHYYRYSTRKKQFKRTPFAHRPKKRLNLIWF